MPADSAEGLVVSLHGLLLRSVAQRTGVHFEGLDQAGGFLRQHGLALSKTARRLAHVSHAFNIARHTHCVSVERFADRVLSEVDSNINGTGLSRQCSQCDMES